jgi:asparagine synthase (glutamine-hydrolysing)
LTGQEILDDLPEALAAVDQPTVDGFNTYFVSRATRRAGLKVALSGLGGDELFGGYASFHDVPRALRLRRKLGWIGPANGVVSWMLDWTSGRRGRKAAEMLRRPPTPVSVYFLRRELFLRKRRRDLHPQPAGMDPYSGVPQRTVEDMLSRSRGLGLVNQVSLFELEGYMRHMLLRDSDVFSMRHGLELRVPLLDHKVVEQVAALPGSYKLPDSRPKPLLIDAVGARLPAVVYKHPKRGFTFPWAAWLRGPLRQRAVQAMDNRDIWHTLGLNPEAPRQLWDRFVDKDRRVSALQVLALMVLENFASQHELRWVA